MHFIRPAHQLSVRTLSGVLLRALKVNIIYHKDMNTRASLRDEAPTEAVLEHPSLLVSNLGALNVCEDHTALEERVYSRTQAGGGGGGGLSSVCR